MHEIKKEGRWGSDPHGKPRIYFTCHPDDFDTYFERVCEDLFEAHDCAVYYTADMREPIPKELHETDLGSNNLFVVPVTKKLLTEPNRAMDEDIRYAKENNLSILPLMMEKDAVGYYSRDDKFGKRQYLSPDSTDETAVSYKEKLKKFLDEKFSSYKLIEQIREAFYGYLFLSYRKEDRYYANELMKAVHAIKGCEGMAIWYDEFLTPGEDFNENIFKALNKCSVFLMVVTPNMLKKRPNGQPNFVMSMEYPTARKLADEDKVFIIPVEMVKTNKLKMKLHFKGIGNFVKFDSELRDEFLWLFISSWNERLRDIEPTNTQCFLIGCAYLDGIDVEVNVELGIEFLKKGALKGSVDAMERLFFMYLYGERVAIDYSKAVCWGEDAVKGFIDIYGEENLKTLEFMNFLALAYSKRGQAGDYEKSLNIHKKVYSLKHDILGEEDKSTLSSLSNNATACMNLGRYEEALKLQRKAYLLMKKTVGDDDPETLTIANNLAQVYSKLKRHKDALEILEKAYSLECKVSGVKHKSALITLNNIALEYHQLKEYKKALELYQRAYSSLIQTLGKFHPVTLASMSNMALTYLALKEYDEALKLSEKAYFLRRECFGENHPDTLASLHNLASCYDKMGNDDKSLELYEKSYLLMCNVLGEKHPDTLVSLANLASVYKGKKEYKKAFELREKVYKLRCEVIGNEHSDTIMALSNLAVSYCDLGDYEKSLEKCEEAYELERRISGEKHPKTLTALRNLSVAYDNMGEFEKVNEIRARLKKYEEEGAN